MVDAERGKQRALSLRKRSAKAKAQVQADVDAQDTTPAPSMGTTTPTSQHAVPVAEGGVDSERKDDAEVMPDKAPRFDAGVSEKNFSYF